MSAHKTLFGIDVFLKQQAVYKNDRIGLVTNNAAITSNTELSRTAILKAGFNIVKLFSPEHGITAEAADGSFLDNSIDPVTSLPVISLYGDKLMPEEKDFSDIDLVVFDIPDVGVRFYTYLWTLTYITEACSAFNKPLIILDRPNPLSGDLSKTEGPMLDEQHCSSFIGRWNIPVRHSCTLGELATYFTQVKKINIDLTVIKNKNWNRNILAGTDWKFTPTSPAITDIETALLYPGMGMMEGINVNEGRGSATPFKFFGAPWINSKDLQENFLNLSLPGIIAESISYTLADSLYVNELCHGLKLTITDAEKFKPVLTGLELIKLIQNLFPDKCGERFYKTVANPKGKNHLDKLTGVLTSFEKLKNGELLTKYYTTENWSEIIRPYLFY